MVKITEHDELIAVLAEAFRQHGYAGTSLSEITQSTGLGKGSLYHYFPDGKEGMARAVLEDVADWFETNVFQPLRASDPAAGIDHMFRSVSLFFASGRRICLVGAFAIDDTRDYFAVEIRKYFSTWTEALAGALRRKGLDSQSAKETAEEVIGGIQGALVLARSLNDPGIFTRAIRRLSNAVAD